MSKEATAQAITSAFEQREFSSLQQLFREAPVGLCLMDTDMRYVHINERLAEMNGAPVSEHIGKSLSEVIPEIADMVIPFHRSVIESGQPIVDTEVTGTTAAAPDVIKTWLANFYPLRNASGQITGVGTVVQDITDLKHIQQELEYALAEIRRLKEQLEHENIDLRQRVSGLDHSRHDLVGQSEPMRLVLAQAEQVAATDTSVLLLGETGTGKELIAQAIHHLGTRKDRPLIKVNCAALSPTLIESELFGHEKGAYTGALSAKAGRFEIADGATLFLDEIGELPPEVQAKLLRVIEDGSFERVGGTSTRKTDVRLICATNRDLEKSMHEGAFRADLFYRLNVFPITLPPLRDLVSDIPLLVWGFIQEFAEAMGRHVEQILPEDMHALQVYAWPGNVRELRNM